MCCNGGGATTQAMCLRMREVPSSRSTLKLGAMRCCGLKFTIFDGMTCGIPSRPGTGKLELLPTNCNALAAGKPSPWWRGMLTWRQKGWRLLLVA